MGALLRLRGAGSLQTHAFTRQPLTQHVNFNGQIAAVLQQGFTVSGSEILFQIVQ